ncbi:hypothetical protein F5Y16DRAFT_386492 [Xylariaceae sp. FL0255]|nr:hypothetical protein F5Y16DRAFT_386492 [Xylariaceae sp. FL0255]
MGPVYQVLGPSRGRAQNERTVHAYRLSCEIHKYHARWKRLSKTLEMSVSYFRKPRSYPSSSTALSKNFIMNRFLPLLSVGICILVIAFHALRLPSSHNTVARRIRPLPISLNLSTRNWTTFNIPQTSRPLIHISLSRSKKKNGGRRSFVTRGC